MLYIVTTRDTVYIFFKNSTVAKDLQKTNITKQETSSHQKLPYKI